MFIEIAVAQAKAGLYTEALHTAQRIEDATRRATALSLIAEELMRTGRRNHARLIHHQAIKAAQEIDDAAERAEVLTKAALIFLKEPDRGAD